MKGRLLAIAAIALLVASACSSGASTKEASEPAHNAGSEAEATTATKKTVLLPKSYTFAPEVVEVAEGGTVTWINKDDFPHTVRLLDGSEGDRSIAVGDSTSITFERAGTFRYDCSLHPTQMSGEVIVGESSS
jgi:plastocyanin